jgi:AraC family transcriptional regulator
MTGNLSPLRVVPKPVEQLLFQSSTVAVGRFRCAPEHPLFADSGPSNAYCFVFPRTSVWIQHAGAPPFVAHPGVVTFYNEGQVYSRRAVRPDGDRAEWFAVAPHVVEEVLAAVAPRALGPGRRLFRDAWVPSDAATYLRQRRLVEALGSQADPLVVEETVVGLLAELAARAGQGRPSRGPISRRQRELVGNAKMLLAMTIGRRVRLAEIAAQLSCSVFHVCHTFQRVEGRTMRAYRNDVRLRAALEAVMDRRTDLSQIALDAGFSSHSHFTASFRAHFGVTPSALTAGAPRPAAHAPVRRAAR